MRGEPKGTGEGTKGRVTMRHQRASPTKAVKHQGQGLWDAQCHTPRAGWAPSCAGRRGAGRRAGCTGPAVCTAEMSVWRGGTCVLSNTVTW